MDLELHEQILLVLYASRYSVDSVDLLSNFNSFPESIVQEKAQELEKKGLVKLEFPFLGIGSFNMRTGEMSFPNAPTEKYIKAKLTIDGIDYVNRELKSREDFGNF